MMTHKNQTTAMHTYRAIVEVAKGALDGGSLVVMTIQSMTQ
jgi:hypothetical protein